MEIKVEDEFQTTSFRSLAVLSQSKSDLFEDVKVARDNLHNPDASIETTKEESCCNKRMLVLLSLFIVFNFFGVLWFTEVENLSLISSLYLITIVFTTVGYG